MSSPGSLRSLMHKVIIAALFLSAFVSIELAGAKEKSSIRRPNIFIAISDDQSWPHASAYGSKMVSTPHFDRIAKEGVLFNNAFSPSPGCSPSRAAFLTGRNTWQIEHAGTHASFFDPKYETFPDRLQKAGYVIGSTGKAWGPGNWKKLGRTYNPAGPSFSSKGSEGKWKGYSAGFKRFLNKRPKDKPFCFWFGSSDPHRAFKKGAGLEKGKTLKQAEVPSFLPDTDEIRNDLLDYTFEVERFDDDLGKMIQLLEEAGELDNTFIIVTSDNGMAFPRAKANCYEYGTHVPLAIRWGKQISTGRVVDDLVGFTDLTRTIYEISGAETPTAFPLSGKSILEILKSSKSGLVEPQRSEVFFARERHSSSRYRTLGYPQRALRTHRYLYIKNFKSERWPAGPAQKFDSAQFDDAGKMVLWKLGAAFGGFHDIDACPTLTYLIKNRENSKVGHFLKIATEKRPSEELFDIVKDPGCLNNLIDKDEFKETGSKLRQSLLNYLKSTGDARVTGKGDVWETYPRVSRLRWFPTPRWAKQNPMLVPKQEWLEARRPRKKSKK